MNLSSMTESQADLIKQDEAESIEFAEFLRTQDPIEVAATLWATRQEQGLDPDMALEFKKWLDASPSHAQALQDAQASFSRVKKMPPEAVSRLKALIRTSPDSSKDLSRIASASDKKNTLKSPGRRSCMVTFGRLVPQMVAASAVIASVGTGLYQWSDARKYRNFHESFQTARGELKTIELPDGSKIELDTATRLEATLSSTHREVRLIAGQAMFSVSHDPGRPFDVVAGNTKVTVVGTRFIVRRTDSGLDAGITRVRVEEGRVRVRATTAAVDHASQPFNEVYLSAGQSVTNDRAGKLSTVSAVPAGTASTWQQGRVSFVDVPLDQALAEFERYGPTGLVIHDPDVAKLRLGGSFNLHQVDSFSSALPKILPVHVVSHGKIGEIALASTKP